MDALTKVTHRTLLLRSYTGVEDRSGKYLQPERLENGGREVNRVVRACLPLYGAMA